MALRSSEGPLTDVTMPWEQEIPSLAYCTFWFPRRLSFLMDSRPMAPWVLFHFCFFKINFADERWGAFRKKQLISGPLGLCEEGPGSAYQLLPAHPRLPASFHFLPNIPEPQAAIVSRTALLGSLGTVASSASCCYKASLSCWKQRHFPAVCNPFGATHFFHEFVQCLQILGVH